MTVYMLMRDIQQKLRKFTASHLQQVLAVLAVIVVGSVALMVTHAAATSSVVVDTTLAKLSGGASIVQDSGALGGTNGGEAVEFGRSGTPGGNSGSGSGGVITAGDSKAHCITLGAPTPSIQGEISPAILSSVESATGLTYNCLETFDNPVGNWTDWEDPWQFNNDPSTTGTTSTYETWAAWLKTGHQMILGVDLIPQSAGGPGNPQAWETSCAAGGYNTYATQLAKNLVSYGAGGIVIRLGIEANGSWETDYTGSTTQELSDWAKCYDNEVTAMRAVAGANFLFVWNPNVCTQSFPINEYYPGNAYVDIIGVDAYDEDCHNSETVAQEGWQDYYTDSLSGPGANFPSIANFLAFAHANNKPLSFPEWGINQGTSDDATYVTNMAQLFNANDFSFEAYFDTGGDGIQQLGSGIPNATAAYTKAFK